MVVLMFFRYRKSYSVIAAISLFFFVGLSLLQVSAVKCCKGGKVCPISGSVSDFDKDGDVTFFDCFSKKQGKNKTGEEYAKKLKQAVGLSASISLPEFTGYALVSCIGHRLYDDHFPEVPALPG
jgi:hypothetical protein